MSKTSYASIVPFATKDGSEIRELMHPAAHGNRAQSFAEAVVAPGQKTALHRHQVTEEIYHIARGGGLMTLGAERFAVGEGDTICIAPGVPHCIENTGGEPLRIYCSCVPAYSHQDTELL